MRKNYLKTDIVIIKTKRDRCAESAKFSRNDTITSNRNAKINRIQRKLELYSDIV